MNWLLTLILCTAILSWVVTHKYQEEIEELKKKHKKEIKEYENELFDALNYQVELQNEIKDLKRRKY